MTAYLVASGGDPVVYMTLPDAQKLQFDLAPPAARVQIARGAEGTTTDTVNAVIARLTPNASPKRWQTHAALEAPVGAHGPHRTQC